MSKPPEIDRKTLKSPDEFVKKGTAFIGSLARHRSQAGLFVVIAIGLIVLGYGYDWWASKKSDEAWKAFYEAEKVEEAKRWDALKSFADKYPKTRAMLLASLKIADHHFDEAKKALVKDSQQVPQDAAVAAEWYTKALTFTALLPSEKQLILINRAQSLELQRKYDEALTELRSAAEIGGDLKGLALLNQGRIFELKADKKQALELYEKVSGDFLNSEYSKMAKNNVRRLNSPLLSGIK